MATYDKERIIRYVEEELSAEERQQFEADLQKDPSLVAEVSLYEELKATLRQRLLPDDGAAALRRTLKGMNAKYFGAAAETSSVLRNISSAEATRVSMTRRLTRMAAPPPLILALLF